MRTARLDIRKLGEPWAILAEVARNVDTDAWVLVGGLMTKAHALLSGLPDGTVRPTSDVDLLIDVLSTTFAASKVTRGLSHLGFELCEPTISDYAHRFVRDGFVVDVLIVDHPPKSTYKHNKVRGWPIMFVDGGQSAAFKKTRLELVCDEDNVTINIPDILGALVLKCAAARKDHCKMRHLQDAALLASLVEDPLLAKGRLIGNDRKRIDYARELIVSEGAGSDVWRYVSRDAQRRAIATLSLLSASTGL